MRIENSYFSKEYFLGIPEGLSIINLGSTYSQFAFNNYRELGINGCNLALQQHPLEDDWEILKKYHSHLRPKAIVAIVLAPCVLMARPFIHTYPSPFSKSSIKSKVKALLGRFTKGDITDYYPIAYNEELKEEHIQALVEGWKKLFSLPNLKECQIPELYKKNIDYNIDVLSKIIMFCHTHSFTPIIVITPMSERLNPYFSQEFVKTVLLDSIDKAMMNSKQVPVLNYREDELFRNKPSFWLDGGFRLSKLGSKVFLRRFINDIKELRLI